MSRYVDIDELTRDVLASVEVSSEKTASAPELELHTEIGQSLKQAADSIRGYADTTVTTADLQTVVEGAKLAVFGGNTTASQTAGGMAGMGAGALAGGVAGSLLGPMGTIGGAALGGMLGSNVGSNTAQAATNMTQSGAVQPMSRGGWSGGQQGQQMRTASDLGNELRKLATQIREQGANNEEIRLTKAAQMLTAAVGLRHLTEDFGKDAGVLSKGLGKAKDQAKTHFKNMFPPPMRPLTAAEKAERAVQDQAKTHLKNMFPPPMRPLTAAEKAEKARRAKR